VATRLVLLLCLGADVGYAITFDALTSIAHCAAIVLGILMISVHKCCYPGVYEQVKDEDSDSDNQSDE
jgi:hypothetical protein